MGKSFGEEFRGRVLGKSLGEEFWGRVSGKRFGKSCGEECRGRVLGSVRVSDMIGGDCVPLLGV